MKTAFERVKAGAAFLDARQAGWAGQIKIDELDLFTKSCCILGQLADQPTPPGTYPFDQGCAKFGLAETVDVQRLGFYPIDWTHQVDAQAECAELTKLWKEEVATRLAA